jgi:8-oxo-dGTP diphosphatase
VIYLVRHAKAGSRRDWTDDDVVRPLSKKGIAQAEALARRMRKRELSVFVSSPYLRCVQTLIPLASQRNTAVTTDVRLEEEQGFEGALELLAEVPDGAVLCSHGDVIPATMAALERRGCQFLTEPDWRKATVWLLDRAADGSITTATVWAPPGE